MVLQSRARSAELALRKRRGLVTFEDFLTSPHCTVYPVRNSTTPSQYKGTLEAGTVTFPITPEPNIEKPIYQGPKRCWYSAEVMKALTISAFTKLPLNWLSLLSQKS